jgi:hypothetical protein
MRQIIYRSTTTAESRNAIDDIPDILREAAARNGVDGISGLLYTEADAFLQAIEGNPESVEDLLDRLRNDPRHRDLQILIDRPIDRREFGDWAMIYRDRRESLDMFDDRMRVLLAGVSAETTAHFRALQSA